MNFTIIRFLKSTFIRFRLHGLFSWLTGPALQLTWMARLSKWVSENKKIAFNDFPSKWDYNKRYDLYRYVIEKEKLDIDLNYLEFGVASGESFKWFLQQNKNPGSNFYGFDTFDGLPEDWGPYKKGAFSTHNTLPEINDARGKFYKGLYAERETFLKKGFK